MPRSQIRMLWYISALLIAAVVAAGPTHAPDEYFYTSSNGKVTQEQQCRVTRWEGIDPYGSGGYPSVATIECPEGRWYEAEGWSAEGPLQYYVWDGELAVNDQSLSFTGSMFWVNIGSKHTLKVKGKAYVVGAPFMLLSGEGAVFPDAYDGLQWKGYDVADALAGRNNATLVHDIHISNGTDDNNAKDIAWTASSLHLEPAAITVLNCGRGKCAGNECSQSGNETFVWDHYHPNGALYLPYVGQPCFWNPDEKCSSPGFPRWTSPVLRYYETFKAADSTEVSDSLRKLINASGPWTYPCTTPVVFSVTHFDPDGGKGGTPNFVDNPLATAKGAKKGAVRAVAHHATQRLTRLYQYSPGR